MSYNLRVVIFVGVCFHVPNYLVRKELRELGRFQNVALDIAQGVVSESLDDLRNIKERHIDRVALQCPHGILDQTRMVLIRRQKEGDCSDRVDWRPEEQVLAALSAGGHRQMGGQGPSLGGLP
jgi:hypothetical protein